MWPFLMDKRNRCTKGIFFFFVIMIAIRPITHCVEEKLGEQDRTEVG